MSDLSITTLKAGEAVRQIDEALDACWRDLRDPGAALDARRSVTVRIVLTPSESEPGEVGIEVSSSAKLAPRCAVSSVALVSGDSTSARAQEWQQPELPVVSAQRRTVTLTRPE